MAHNVEPVVDAIPAAEKTGTTETTETTGRQTYLIPLRDLLPPDSPRLAGESVEHIRLLAEVAEALPPILVHRNTMKIIDGAHRVGAARLRGETSIRVRFFDGTAEAAFVEGVRANTTHGLPLSRADREAAALRIAAIHPTWSHRAIAAASGLSDKTVKQLRLRSTGGLPHLDTRVGLDGRFRPITAAPGRERAAEALASRPDASLREIARLAGVSPGTVRNVRERLRRGEDPLTVGRPRATGPRPASTGPAGGGAGRGEPSRERIADRLRGHPDLREGGGLRLMQWVDAWMAGLKGAERIVEAVPPHCAYILARIARSCAMEFDAYAQRLEQPAAGDMCVDEPR